MTGFTLSPVILWHPKTCRPLDKTAEEEGGYVKNHIAVTFHTTFNCGKGRKKGMKVWKLFELPSYFTMYMT
jgi:hypothetical protein